MWHPAELLNVETVYCMLKFALLVFCVEVLVYLVPCLMFALVCKCNEWTMELVVCSLNMESIPMFV